MIGFEAFENRTIIKGKVKLLTGLHIGKGQSLEPVGTDQPVVKDALSYPFIPGSSFKGVLRSNAERISASLYQGRTDIKEPCFITDDKNSYVCISHTRDVSKVKPKEIWDRMCPVCRLFGSPHFASKIAIKDMTVDKDTWFDHYERRDGVAIDRGTETAAEGKLYDFEIVPAGVEFDLNIVIENATDKDLGLFYLALKDFERGEAFVGGSKTKGLGNIEFIYEEIKEVDKHSIIDYLLNNGGKVYKSKPKETNKPEPLKIDPVAAWLEVTPPNPESVNTLEDLYVVLSIALSKLELSARGDSEAISQKLRDMGISNDKRKQIVGQRGMVDLLTKAINDGSLKKDGRQYVPIRYPNASTENASTDEKTELEKPLEPTTYDLDEYINEKIIEFVNYITQELDPKEAEDAQEKSV